MRVVLLDSKRAPLPSLRRQNERGYRNRIALTFGAVLIAIFMSGIAEAESLPRAQLSQAKRFAEQCSSLESSGNYSRAEAACREALAGC